MIRPLSHQRPPFRPADPPALSCHFPIIGQGKSIKHVANRLHAYLSETLIDEPTLYHKSSAVYTIVHM